MPWQTLQQPQHGHGARPAAGRPARASNETRTLFIALLPRLGALHGLQQLLLGRRDGHRDDGAGARCAGVGGGTNSEWRGLLVLLMLRTRARMRGETVPRCAIDAAGSAPRGFQRATAELQGPNAYPATCSSHPTCESVLRSWWTSGCNALPFTCHGQMSLFGIDHSAAWGLQLPNHQSATGACTGCCASVRRWPLRSPASTPSWLPHPWPHAPIGERSPAAASAAPSCTAPQGQRVRGGVQLRRRSARYVASMHPAMIPPTTAAAWRSRRPRRAAASPSRCSHG